MAGEQNETEQQELADAIDGLERRLQQLEASDEEQHQDDDEFESSPRITPYVLELAYEESGQEPLTGQMEKAGRRWRSVGEPYVLELAPEGYVPPPPPPPPAPPPVYTEEHAPQQEEPPAPEQSVEQMEQAAPPSLSAEQLNEIRNARARGMIDDIIGPAFRPLTTGERRRPIVEELNITSRAQAVELVERIRRLMSWATSEQLDKFESICRALVKKFQLLPESLPKFPGRFPRKEPVKPIRWST